MFQVLLKKTVEALKSIEIQGIKYRGRDFEGVKRWVICFLGSLSNIYEFIKKKND